MAIPTYKTPEMNAMLSALAGKDRVETIIADKCMLCDNSASNFTDEISEKEYTISGMCQACQDKAFEDGDE